MSLQHVVTRTARVLNSGTFRVSLQADFTGWMACYCLWMLQIAVELSEVDLVYCDLVFKFLEHFFNVAVAMNKPIAEKGILLCWLPRPPLPLCNFCLTQCCLQSRLFDSGSEKEPPKTITEKGVALLASSSSSFSSPSV